MKTWKEPEVEELEISKTAYFALTGTTVDGWYISYDTKLQTPTYSGKYSKDIPFQDNQDGIKTLLLMDTISGSV